jgi:hypothetical protein
MSFAARFFRFARALLLQAMERAGSIAPQLDGRLKALL